MDFTRKRSEKYDYAGQSYSDAVPNLHRYPATMIPQIGVDVLKEFGVAGDSLLDPYCGSGSSFLCGLKHGMKRMTGFDINPLAVLISKVRFTRLSAEEVKEMSAARRTLRNDVFDLLKDEANMASLPMPHVTNMSFWFSERVAAHLAVIKACIDRVPNSNLRNFFLLAFSETVRDCSYARTNEFKLVRMKPDEVLKFNPDVAGVFFDHFDRMFAYYMGYYLPKLTGDGDSRPQVDIRSGALPDQQDQRGEIYDAVLTSPPYGDSGTTVAYGQFSALSNEWLGISGARRIDSMLMGGRMVKENIRSGLIAPYIAEIEKADAKRSLEVSSFYADLERSIKTVAGRVRKSGFIIYVVGNRTVKNVCLPTDMFIAEKFEENGCRHVVTYERALSNKAMPSRNSPTNEPGRTAGTMLYEYIVVCEKTAD
ncbi:MAG: hypothetical protein LBR38_04600 [Synergistaceae bacterium]|jgi:DNA modification methylase|nr:hypothetical protein [Synergistaceae bacterium]